MLTWRIPIVAIGAAFLAALWPVAARAEVDIVPNRGHASAVSKLAISGNGRLIATAARRDAVVRLWDSNSLRLMREIRVDDALEPRIALSPDGSLLATAVRGLITLWDTTTGRPSRTIGKKPANPDDDAESYSSISFAHDGAWLILHQDYGTDAILDLGTGKKLRTFGTSEKPVHIVVATGDQPFVAVLTGDDPGRSAPATIEVFRSANWSRQSAISVGDGTCAGGLALAADGQTIWCLGREGIAEIDARSGSVRRKQPVSDPDFREADWGSGISADGKAVRVVAMGAQEIASWSLERWQPLAAPVIGAAADSACAYRKTPDNPGDPAVAIAEITKVALSRTGDTVAAICSEGSAPAQLLVWTPDTSSRPRNQPIALINAAADEDGGSVESSLSRDAGKVVLTGAGVGVEVLDLFKVTSEAKIDIASKRCIAALSENASRIAYQCAAKDLEKPPIRIWEPGTEGVTELSATAAAVLADLDSGVTSWTRSMSADGRYLATPYDTPQDADPSGFLHSATFDATAARLATVGIGLTDLYDTDSGEKIAALEAKYQGPMPPKDENGQRAIDDRLLTPVILWDVKTAKPIRRLDQAAHRVHRIAFSDDGTLVAGAFFGRRAKYRGGDGRITVWQASTGKIVWSRAVNEDGATALYFAPGSTTLVTGSLDGTLKELDGKTGRQIWKLERKLGDRWTVINRSEASADGRWLAVASGTITSNRSDPIDAYAQLELFAREGKALRCKFTGLSSKIAEIGFTSNGERVAASDGNAIVRIWSTASCGLLATLYPFAGGEWVLITPEGFFAASPKGARYLSAVRGGDVFAIDQIYDRLYQPALVRDKLAGNEAVVREAATKLNLATALESGRPPRVSVIAPAGGTSTRDDQITVTASLADMGGGFGHVEWRVDNVVVGLDEKPQVTDGKATLTRVLPLDIGPNHIEIVAYNERNIVSSSPPARVTVTWDGTAATSLPKLYVLAVGINTYADPRLKLTYAVADAEGFATALEQAKSGLYSEVKPVILRDEQATTAGIDAAFQQLAAEIRPRDVFVFYVAGHGKTVDKIYHFIPYEFRYQGLASLKSSAINQDTLRAWLARISARKSVLIYDTCESGTLTGDLPGARSLEQFEWLDRMTRATGRTLLTSARGDQPALEGYRQHGVFTYALLVAIGNAASDENGHIPVSVLANYLDRVVPMLSQSKIGQLQVPLRSMSGTDFPLVRRTKVIADDDGEVLIVPTEPTHAVTIEFDILDSNDQKVMRATRGMKIVLLPVDARNAKPRIARNGRIIGYLSAKPEDVLLRLE